MQKIHTIPSAPVMSTSNTSTTSDLIASVVAGHKINNKNNSNRKISSNIVGVSNNNNNNNNNDNAANINENGSALKKPAPPKPIIKNGKHILTDKNDRFRRTTEYLIVLQRAFSL